ncbi:MAG TPA: helix-turn-helix domain-containing protein [Clostridia bacterium]|nr:helix-turn-helix domain-containing protein [Clostridia bacterium]
MNIEIANRLYNLRKKHGLSQEELAERIGVSRQAVSKWERSESSPDTDNLIALAKIYGVSIDEMLNMETGDTGLSGESSFSNADASMNSSFDETEPEQNDDSDDDEKSFSLRGFPIAIVATIIFFVLGFAYGLWHPAWIVFLIIPLFNFFSGKNGKRKPRGKKYPWLSFPYPILATIIFLLIGFIWGGWIYAWLIFLTIPIWAFFASR